MAEQVDVRSVVMSDSKDNESEAKHARKNDCIIKITNFTGTRKEIDDSIFALYKVYDCAPNKMQNLLRRFYHWLENNSLKDGRWTLEYVVPNLIYFIKRTEEESDEGKFSNWQFDHHLKNYLTIVGAKLPKGMRYIYELNTETQTMKTKEGRWNPDKLIFENYKDCGEVPVGTNYESGRGVSVK